MTQFLLLSLFFISYNVVAKQNHCPKVAGSPIKLSNVDRGLVYFNNSLVACYLNQDNGVIIRIEDTSSTPKISLFYQHSGTSLLQPDSRSRTGYKMIDIVYGLDDKLLMDFIKRRKQKFQVYKVEKSDKLPFTMIMVDNKYLIYNYFLPPLYYQHVFAIKAQTKEKLTVRQDYWFVNGEFSPLKEENKKIEYFNITREGIIADNTLFREILTDEYLYLHLKQLSHNDIASNVINHLTLFKGKPSKYPKAWIKQSVVRHGTKTTNRKRFNKMLNQYINHALKGCVTDCDTIPFSNDLDDYLAMERRYLIHPKNKK